MQKTTLVSCQLLATHLTFYDHTSLFGMTCDIRPIFGMHAQNTTEKLVIC